MKILGKFKPLKPEIALWLCVVESKTSQDKCLKRWVDLNETDASNVNNTAV